LGWGPEHKPTPRGKHRPNKHKDPKYKLARAQKVLKVELPDHDFMRAVQNQVNSTFLKVHKTSKESIPSVKLLQKKNPFIAFVRNAVEI